MPRCVLAFIFVLGLARLLMASAVADPPDRTERAAPMTRSDAARQSRGATPSANAPVAFSTGASRHGEAVGTVRADGGLSTAPGDRSTIQDDRPILLLPSAEGAIVRPFASEAQRETSTRYLPPDLAEPERPASVPHWAADLPQRDRDMPPGPDIHPAARTDRGALCDAPPDTPLAAVLKMGWAQDGYGNAESTHSYLPFQCY
jgi:hypothetical protein